MTFCSKAGVRQHPVGHRLGHFPMSWIWLKIKKPEKVHRASAPLGSILLRAECIAFVFRYRAEFRLR